MAALHCEYPKGHGLAHFKCLFLCELYFNFFNVVQHTSKVKKHSSTILAQLVGNLENKENLASFSKN